MKLLTLNTHSLEESDTPAKQRIFAREILKLQPDIIALQEVNQTMTAAPSQPGPDYTPAQHAIPVKADNHALA
ncbi:endonuclease/exonuclease/phosphatase family protein, partial [uncultured Faecalibaculum sp.]